MTFHIELLPALADNYIFVISDPELGLAMVVDPGDGDRVMQHLKKNDLYLALILNTHHHSDCVNGNEKLQQEYGAPVIGPEKEKSLIPGLSRSVGHGDVVSFSTLRGKVIETHGHTDGHISYYFPHLKSLFCGDALFSLGCGRLFEGNSTEMWESLKLLRNLPDDTKVYCNHENSEANAKFALMIDKDNEELKRRADEIAALRKQGKPSIPAMLGEEKLCNPFLRTDNQALRAALAKTRIAPEDADPAAVFGLLRSAKDHFGQQKI